MSRYDELRRRGFAAEVGFGLRPAVVVVDLMRAFTDPDSPLGSDLDSEVAATRRLIDVARQVAAPVVFTVTEYDAAMEEAGLFAVKIPSLRELRKGTPAVELDPRLGRLDDDPVVVKKFASAFFDTGLAATLRRMEVDTTIVTGCTTSGCVRATVVDALQHGFRAIVPRQCVGDRVVEAHEANLYDIHVKYGDVVELSEAIESLEGLRGGRR